ncbi:MAG: phage tail protein [Sphingobium sp. 66-54]|nr:MAG: phage tail protein [Sphingobium sp. 66-54]
MTTFTATALQGETVDALVWRVLGAGSGTVEQVLDLNRDIAALGPVLPEGHPVSLPLLLTPEAPARAIVHLWD